MDIKNILSKLDGIDAPAASIPSPKLPSAIKLDESAEMRVLSGQATYLSESKKVQPTVEALDEESEIEEITEKEDEAIEEVSDAQQSAQEKFKNLVKSKKQKVTKESAKPSAGLTKKEKSAVVKKAKAGKDIGKKGKGFEKVAKAATKEYGSKEKGQKVAAAAMWKQQAAKKKAVKESVEHKLTFKQLVSLVQESGGQQQIDPLDAELFSWAQRVASAKYEGAKQEIYAGMVYERMGGEFQLYDVLSEAALTRPQMARQIDLANRAEEDYPVPDYVIADFDDDFYDAAWHNFDESEQFFDALKAVGRAHVTNQKDPNAVAALVHVVQDLYGKAIDQYMAQHKAQYQKQADDDMIGDSFGEAFEMDDDGQVTRKKDYSNSADRSGSQAKRNWFPTLNAALESEDLIDQWPLGRNISYGETARVHSNDGTQLISVTRDGEGRYERPVHYNLR